MGNRDKKKRREERLRKEKHKRHFEKPLPKLPVDEVKLTPGGPDLHRDGILLKASVGVPKTLEHALRAAGRPVPNPVNGYMLVDTGATFTSIAEKVAEELGLKPTGVRETMGVSGKDERPVFQVRVLLPDFGCESNLPMLAVKDMMYVGNDSSRRLLGLLGRDFLRHSTLIYDGDTGEVQIKLHRDTLGKKGPPKHNPLVLPKPPSTVIAPIPATSTNTDDEVVPSGGPDQPAS